jgi:hypothetical protein
MSYLCCSSIEGLFVLSCGVATADFQELELKSSAALRPLSLPELIAVYKIVCGLVAEPTHGASHVGGLHDPKPKNSCKTC